MRKQREGRYTVTGAGVERTAVSVGAGLSLATTLASRRGMFKLGDDEATFYVRDITGELVGRVNRSADGFITVEALA